MTEPSPQRAYRAACPNCGAPVEFRSAASAFAVCSYCQSQVVRDGDALRRIGQGAELFDDHSPLALGAAGRLQGTAFTLVGRLQYRTPEGTWNEWHALFDNGRSGWVAEDNGRYVFSFDVPLATAAPPPFTLRPGAGAIVGGQPWSVASVVQAELVAAQGELPRLPKAGALFTVVDLRNAQGEVGTLDYADPEQPAWSIGRSVALDDLALTGLAAPSEKTLGGRNFACPNCGNGITLQLEGTKSVVCGQCHAVVDVSQGIGGDLAHHAQAAAGGSEPQIPLGSVGTLALGGPAVPWQVVGYTERVDLPDSSEDEPTPWREYLLYHRTSGFAFLVDADDGWSWVVPATGVPEPRGDRVQYQGATYQRRFSYRARVTWVLGEFYWKLELGQVAVVTDYHGTGAAAHKRLSREASAEEVVWSAGEALDAATLRAAFRLAPEQAAMIARDAAPVSASAGSFVGKVLTWGLILLVLFIVAMCSDDDEADCDTARRTFGEASLEYRNCLANRSTGGGRAGGSWGGFSTGGGHK